MFLYCFRNIDLHYQSFGKMLAEVNSFKSDKVNFTAYESDLSEVNTTELYLALAHRMDYKEMFIL